MVRPLYLWWPRPSGISRRPCLHVTSISANCDAAGVAYVYFPPVIGVSLLYLSCPCTVPSDGISRPIFAYSDYREVTQQREKKG